MQSVAFAQQEFSFRNQSSFIDDNGIMHVVGEIKNESDKALKNVLVTALFYDTDGRLIGEYSRNTELRIINPGQTSPFEVLYIEQKSVDQVANYTLSAAGQESIVKEERLRIVSFSSRLDLLGTYYIYVLAKNEGQLDARNSIVIATLYDKENRTLAIGKALAEAGPGSSDMKPGSEAAFGVVITEKSQTYKAASYSLVVDSDEYLSDVVSARSTGAGSISSSGNQSQTSGCLIATAAFGSELAPQVDGLRTFRDKIVLQSFAGSSFLRVFNAWYYAFSPSVADYERESVWLQHSVRISLYPLLAVLQAGVIIHDAMTGIGTGNEVATVATGITASFLLGITYLSPVGIVLGVLGRKREWNLHRLGIAAGIALLAATMGIAIAWLIATPWLMMFASALLVIAGLSTAVLLVAGRISKLQRAEFAWS